MGGSLLCFENKSKAQNKLANNYFSLSIFALVVLGVLFFIICFFLNQPIMNFLCADETLRIYSRDYIKYYSIGFPFLMFTMGISYFMRNDNNQNKAFACLLTANIVNLCLDFVFIQFLDMGIAGSGLASSVGFICGFIVSLFYFKTKKRSLIIIKPYNVLYKLVAIFKRGFPSAAIMLYRIITLFILNNYFLVTSMLCFYIYTVFNNIMFIPLLIFIGFAQTSSPFISVYLQHKDYTCCNHIFILTLLWCVGLSALLAIIFCFNPEIINLFFNLRQYVDSTLIINAYRIVPCSFMGEGVVFVLVFYCQAINKTTVSNILSILHGLIIPVICLPLSENIFGYIGLSAAFVLNPIIICFIYIVYTRFKYKSVFIIPVENKQFIYDSSIKADDKYEIEVFIEKLKEFNIKSDIIDDIINNVFDKLNNAKFIDISMYKEKENFDFHIKYLGIPAEKNGRYKLTSYFGINDVFVREGNSNEKSK